MTETLKKTLRESTTARWMVLLIVSFTMLTGYYFADVMSPLKPMVQKLAGWDNNSAFGLYFGAYSWFNVFFGMLIIGGIILDKMGIRFTGTTFVLLMAGGAALNYYALTDTFINGGPGFHLFDSFWGEYSASTKMASLGFAIFGVGVEIAGVTVSRIIVKWFMGKELALAMGLQVAIARMGTAAALFFAPRIAGIDEVVTRPVAFGVILLLVGFLAYLVYNVMDVKLDKEDVAANGIAEEEEFKLVDVGKILSNKAFIYIAMLCVLFYSGVFPFLKYASDLMVNKFGVPAVTAGDIPSILPFGTILLTPLFGYFLDRKGKGASIMIFGSILLILVHLSFAFGSSSIVLAYALMIILGIAFSLVPAAMWPSVPKIVPEQYLGTAYSVIFWVQNIGLWGVPMFIGWVLDKTNPGVLAQIKQGVEGVKLDYMVSMVVFALTGFIGLLFAFLLKIEDKKKGYGLELPNKE
jgi:predicted MFS family arabinose efflux permease